MSTLAELTGPTAETPADTEQGRTDLPPEGTAARHGDAPPPAKVYTARAELTLAREDSQPLRTLPLRPDPLTAFARAMADVRADLGESAEIHLDLLPVTAGQRRQRRRKEAAAARRQNPGGGGLRQALLGNGGTTSVLTGKPAAAARTGRRAAALPATSLPTMETRATDRATADKLLSTEPTFRAQLLIRVRSEIPGRAEAHLHAILAGFEQFGGANHWKVSGTNLGFWHLGADSRWRRGDFDARADTGLFRPRAAAGRARHGRWHRRRGDGAWVTASEITGLLKPPTAHCAAPNVLRSGGVIPPPPLGLPTYTGQPHLMPLGKVRAEKGMRPVGVKLDETFFTLMSGRSRFGKALSLQTPIPTPDGWTTMGRIRTGDTVFDEAGRPTRVVGTSDVMRDHTCYEVVFNDGQTIIADAGHRWLTHDYAARKSVSEARWKAPSRDRKTSGTQQEILAVTTRLDLTAPDAVTSIPAVINEFGRDYIVRQIAATTPTAGTTLGPVHPHPRWGTPTARTVTAYPAAQLLGGFLEHLRTDKHDQQHKRPQPSIVTTEQILATLRTPDGKHANHAVPLAKPLRYPEKQLPLDPYLLGLWLGDGNTADGVFTSLDAELVDAWQLAGYVVTPHKAAYRYGIRGLVTQLRALKVLGDKHIPAAYLRGSVSQRVALLQGLMDTDGTCSTTGHCDISITCRPLADGIEELLLGLGVRVVRSTRRAILDGKDCGLVHRLTFTPHLPVFRLGRKLARQNLGDHQPNRRFRYIVDVRPVPSRPVKCIAVDSPNHLFLAGRACIPTHNTEASMGRFLTMVRAGNGGLYLDPHRDALEKMKPYLVDVADRVLEIDLSPRGLDATQAGWNLFSMEGLGRGDIEARVSAIVDSFSSALGWGEINNRALSILTMASQSLCELALVLPVDLAPTLFQLTTVLANEEWRQIALPFMSAQSAGYWENRFARLAGEAIMPVTNLVDRLRASNAVAALFGSSRSTYNVRHAMDEGGIVLACPAGIGDKDKLIANFFIFDLLRAGLSRRDTPPEGRRPFHAFVDEMQTIDGASSGNLAAILEQIGKFGVRLHGMVQQPGRLTKDTLGAFFTNRSHLFSTAVMEESAKVLAKEWRNAITPSTVQGLARYTHLANVTLDGEVTLPFLVNNFEVAELLGGRPDVYPEPLLGEHYRPDDIAELDAAVDANLHRRPVRDTLADLDTLDDRIAAWLASHHPHSGGPTPPEPPAPPTPPKPKRQPKVDPPAAPSVTAPAAPSAPAGRGGHLRLVVDADGPGAGETTGQPDHPAVARKPYQQL